MSQTTLVAIPVKPFDSAKARLAAAFDPSTRARLSQEVAGRTIEAVDAAGAEPLVVARDDTTRDWATRMGVHTLSDEGGGLDAAARMAVTAATSSHRTWAICHADLPHLTAADIGACLRLLEDGRPVLAPSSDGGTSLIGWNQPVRFSYGPESFHRHLRALARHDPCIVIRNGLLLDLDQPDDVLAARSHPRGLWMNELLPKISAS